MADIVLSKGSNFLFRKIGYSVGLEDPVTRIKKIAELYAERQGITPTEWAHFIDELGFKKSPQKMSGHLLNFYQSLGIIEHISGKQIIPKMPLDALGIFFRKYSDEELRNKAARAVFLRALLLNDSDIFLPLLTVGFDGERIPTAIDFHVKEKRKFIHAHYPNRAFQQRINSIIIIEKQLTNTGSSEKKIKGPFAGRVAKKENLDDAVDLTSDWLKKVPARRRIWAEDLGLFANKQLTLDGTKLIDKVSQLYGDESPQFLSIFPTKFELSSAHLTTQLPPTLALEISDFDNLIHAVQTNETTTSPSDLLSKEYVEECFKRYKSVDKRKGSLIRDLPFNLLSLLWLLDAIASNVAFPTEKALREALVEDGQILIRSSRQSKFAIQPPKREKKA